MVGLLVFLRPCDFDDRGIILFSFFPANSKEKSRSIPARAFFRNSQFRFLD